MFAVMVAVMLSSCGRDLSSFFALRAGDQQLCKVVLESCALSLLVCHSWGSRTCRVVNSTTRELTSQSRHAP